MKLLLDTQCCLWWFAEPNRLSEEVITQIASEANELWFSVASVWEIGIKVSIGKLPLPEPLDSYISSRMTQLGVQLLDIKVKTLLNVRREQKKQFKDMNLSVYPLHPLHPLPILLKVWR
ncbi:PilT protein domain protein [Calothrix sp. NIES-4071]|nr:PilT protein domain protein [Calothrix sp. NIES-4071]BAZ56461.1 PilT protein domain protein [Calothrix sp. NIES-4105]